MSWSREQIAARAAAELRDGQYVNLGIGIPTLIADHLHDRPIMVQSENGIMGVGAYPAPGQEDPDLVNAGKETVTTIAGSSFFDSADSFAMIRGGHIDVAVLGAMQVSVAGDLANWSDGGSVIKGIGGAMDLAGGAETVIAVMTHRTRDGSLKLVRRCSLPLTARACISTIITDIGVLDVRGDHFSVRELAPGETIDDEQLVNLLRATA
ncbi:3-oxoacid CoA-transferase subunit B [Nocardia alni]|uniref:3-oxoacid CoA-transferase subunit B n=1 Tax=Nocardia alni TaxID=2815723 RepID=UPI001C21F066|nr:3-oxoacid CoA-transferase subunit B [Nocardia alni]